MAFLDEEDKQGLSIDGSGEPESLGRKKNKRKIPLPFILFLATSPIVIFTTVWLTVSQMSDIYIENTDLTSAPDSTIITAEAGTLLEPEKEDKEEADSVEQAAEELPDSTLLEGKQAEALMIFRQIAILQQRLSEKQREIDEMSVLVEDRETLAQEITRLQSAFDEQYARLQYLEHTMPEIIIDRLQQAQAEGQIFQPEGAAVEAVAEERQKNLRRLANIYAAMKPADAAPIMARLDETEVTHILMRMRQRNAAKIMSEFDPALSARISQRMGGAE